MTWFKPKPLPSEIVIHALAARPVRSFMPDLPPIPPAPQVGALEFFAAHAPAVPDWFLRLPERAETFGQRARPEELPLDFLVRWRWTFARAMVAVGSGEALQHPRRDPIPTPRPPAACPR